MLKVLEYVIDCWWLKSSVQGFNLISEFRTHVRKVFSSIR